jgi:hypothetical protein
MHLKFIFVDQNKSLFLYKKLAIKFHVCYTVYVHVYTGC